MNPVAETEGLPANLVDEAPIWESTTAPSLRLGATLRASRLYGDGTMYTYSSDRRVTGPSGLPQRVAAPPAWRLDGRIRPEALATIRAAIDDDYSAVAERTPSRASDAVRRGWRGLRTDGRVHVVQREDGAVPGPVTAVEHAIQRAMVPGGVPMDN